MPPMHVSFDCHMSHARSAQQFFPKIPMHELPNKTYFGTADRRGTTADWSLAGCCVRECLHRPTPQAAHQLAPPLPDPPEFSMAGDASQEVRNCGRATGMA